MKLKYVYLPLFTALVFNNANGLDGKSDQPDAVAGKPSAKNRSGLTSSQMTHDDDDLTENVATRNHKPITVPPFKASAPVDVPAPNKSSPKGVIVQGQLPAPKGVGSPKNRIRYHYGSMAADIIKPSSGKPEDE